MHHMKDFNIRKILGYLLRQFGDPFGRLGDSLRLELESLKVKFGGKGLNVGQGRKGGFDLHQLQYLLCKSQIKAT